MPPVTGPGPAFYSAVTPVSLITVRYLRLSACTKAFTCATDIGCTIAPAVSNFAFTSGCARTPLISLFSLSMIGCGVPRGAKTCPEGEVVVLDPRDLGDRRYLR